MYYWITILFSNTLGSALGDYLADDSGLGFAGGAALIGGILAILVLVHHYTRISKVLLFWIATPLFLAAAIIAVLQEIGKLAF